MATTSSTGAAAPAQPRPATTAMSGRGRGVDWMYLTPLFLTLLPLIRIGFRRVMPGAAGPGVAKGAGAADATAAATAAAR